MTRTLFALVGSLLAAGLAHGETLSYNYLEAGYARIDGHGQPDADGVAVQGAFEIGRGFYVFGGYSATEYERFDIDIDQHRLGLGYHHALNQTHDLVFGLNWLQLDVHGPGIGGDSDGAELEVGLRSAWQPNFETLVTLGRQQVDGAGVDDNYLKLSAQYKFSPRWGLVASSTLRDSANEILIGPRLSF